MVLYTQAVGASRFVLRGSEVQPAKLTKLNVTLHLSVSVRKMVDLRHWFAKTECTVSMSGFLNHHVFLKTT